jgi:hypothetical protein
MDEGFRSSLRPAGYLVAPTYLTRTTRAFAAEKSRRGYVMVDNGRFDDIGRLANLYSVESRQILASMNVPAATGLPKRRDSGRWERLTTEAKRESASLLHRISSYAASAEPGMNLQQQLTLAPSAVIGVEDITAATWLRLGLDIDLLLHGRAKLRQRNIATARRAAFVIGEAGLLSQSTIQYLPVASAMDYDTAFDAARAFAAEGLQAVAIGFGAFMADDSYCEAFKMAGRWRSLGERLPNRYLRTILVARGFWDGWSAETQGKAPGHLHFLGLGAPIMLGLVALVGFDSDSLTFDATSPIRDAVDGTLYLNRPAPLKARCRSLALRMADHPEYLWACRCPFCKSYLAENPFNQAAARAWRQSNPARALTAADLRSESVLGRAVPLFSEPRGGPARKDIDRARIGHNHWILQQTLRQIDKRSRNRRDLEAHVERQVSAYEQAANANSFARAVRFAYQLASQGV